MDEKEIRRFESSVEHFIADNNLLKRSEKIIVACSGGKDSTVSLYLLKKFGYEPEAMIVDLKIGNYSRQNLENVRKFCGELGVKLHVVDFRDEFGSSVCYIRSVLSEKENLKSCTVCGVMKRYVLNKKARELGADKLVLGHNLDDEAQTIMMNLTITGGPELCLNMGPIVGKRKDKMFVPRVKPLFRTYERDIRAYSKARGFPVIYERCPCAIGSHRFNMRDMLDEWDRKRPGMKERLLDNFLDVLPGIREHLSTGGEAKPCSGCGEPSRDGICATCKMMSKLAS